ncbi:hypothetical protein KKD62_01135 [Patescibacteria group bacterium]|nr:hypothetical protein [Patescibacteria group bacterium]MBU1931353.1 hypothetical protein [Patescibacteria group bacterium]
MENAQTNPVKKTSKLTYIYVLLILGALVLVGEGVYYFTLKKSKTAGSNEPNISSIEAKRYFEGLDYYEEIKGERHLLTTEGIVSNIDSERKIITLKRDDGTKSIQYNESDSVIILQQEQSIETFFSDIKIGDCVSYNSSNNTKEQPVWIIQKNR